MPNIIRSPLASRDLEEIWYYIAKDNLAAADALLDRIEEKCRLLAAQPEMGELRPEFATGRYRSFGVGSYVIYYRPVSGGIWIARVLHGARNHGRLL